MLPAHTQASKPAKKTTLPPTLPPTHPQHAPGWAWRLHRRGLAAVEAGLKGFKEGAVCMLEKIGELCHLRGAERAAAVVGHQRQVVREDP